jgi:hypothetical protein
MLKYGKLALVDALSGSSGQTTPPRGSATAPPSGEPAVADVATPVVAAGAAAVRARRRALPAAPASEGTR